MMHTSRVVRSVVLVTAALGLLVAPPPVQTAQPASSTRAAQPAAPPARPLPVPVRNDVPKPGRELLVLRHNELQHGAHDAFYRFSRDLYWPYFERLGARVVGQWKVTDPAGSAPDAHDHVYRLVRYASFEHWQKTRGNQAATLAGNGPAADNGTRGVQDRGTVELGSRGAYFLEGEMAPDGPIHMPGLAEEYALVKSGEPPALSDRDIPVRLDTAQPGDEIVVLRYQRIRKGTFAQFVASTRTRIWPWEGKLGARPIGQWMVVHPTAPDGRTIPALRFITTPSADYDEVVTLTRYRSRAHMEAMAEARAVFMGGNGPDFDAWRGALDEQRRLTLATNVEIVQGFLYQSPPVFLPGLPEQYQRVK